MTSSRGDERNLADFMSCEVVPLKILGCLFYYNGCLRLSPLAPRSSPPTRMYYLVLFLHYAPLGALIVSKHSSVSHLEISSSTSSSLIKGDERVPRASALSLVTQPVDASLSILAPVPILPSTSRAESLGIPSFTPFVFPAAVPVAVPSPPPSTDARLCPSSKLLRIAQSAESKCLTSLAISLGFGRNPSPYFARNASSAAASVDDDMVSYLEIRSVDATRRDATPTVGRQSMRSRSDDSIVHRSRSLTTNHLRRITNREMAMGYPILGTITGRLIGSSSV